jgi:hypothetical protein
MTLMRDIRDFIKARLDDDEDVARSWMSPDFLSPDPDLWHSKGERELADIQAKRELVDEHGAAHACQVYGQHGFESEDFIEEGEICSVLLNTLAATYSHHPDYRPEWGR